VNFDLAAMLFTVSGQFENLAFAERLQKVINDLIHQ